MAISRVCVIGAGTIGSLLASHLSRVCEVSVLTRRAEHADRLAREGLRVTGKTEHHAHPTAASDPAELPEFGLGIFAAKATELEAAAARFDGLARGAAMMTIQNGLGAEEIIRRHGDWPLISAVTFMSGIRHSDVHVEYELDTATWLGPYAGTATPFALVEEVAALIVSSGLRAEAMPDLLPAQWSKLIFNAAINGVSALTELPHVALFAREQELTDLGHVVHAMITEGKAVAAAAGVELHEDPWEMNRLAVARGESRHSDYAHMPSMAEDVLARRPTEVDYINGALVREAVRLGVDAPLNAAVYRLVRGKQASWSLRRPALEGVVT